MFSAQTGIAITLNGDDLTASDHRITEPGRGPMQGPVPYEALPDCNDCPKPELGLLNRQAVWVYSQISHQQISNPLSGRVMGLRFEALVAAIQWFTEAGRILDPDEVMERVLVLDEIACRIKNAKAEAANEASK